MFEEKFIEECLDVEQLAGARYYGGNEFIDQAERLCQQRALDACRLNPKDQTAEQNAWHTPNMIDMMFIYV